MKKIIAYIFVLLIVAIITIGSTYAFFTASITEDPFTSQTHQLEVIYTGDTAISGGLDLVRDKTGGHHREVSIGLSENSVGAAANLYIHVESITSTLATEALTWEIYKKVNNQEELVKTGTFVDCGAIDATKSKCTAGKRIYMITGLELTTTPQSFVVYIWLNGEKAGNEVIGATFKGYIGAETENISGVLQ